jgi:hypothetical protein
VGDKLFLRAIVGDVADSHSISVENWFLELGKSLLEPEVSDKLRIEAEAIQAPEAAKMVTLHIENEERRNLKS